jgi:uncharacterized Zn-binding protein involved in type VI secretion
MPGQARLGDLSEVMADAHGCPGCPHHCVGPAIQGSPNVFVNGMPAVRVGDKGMHAACCGPNMWTAQLGSATVKINGKNAHRKDDMDKHCGLPGIGKIITASVDVETGGPPSAA